MDSEFPNFSTARPQPEAKPFFHIVNPKDLQDMQVRQREWIVEDWLPVGAVTALYGDGGTGKSRLAQQLQASCATHVLPWCGRRVTQVRSLGLYCEDDESELHSRQDLINRNGGVGTGVSFNDLDAMRWISGVQLDTYLVTFTTEGKMHTTEAWNHLCEAVYDLDVRLLVLDTAADVFGGKENDRQQVRCFIRLLGGLAMRTNGAVLLTAHPSRDGLKTGNLDGASTAWNNTTRSRWTLTSTDAGVRTLTRKKSNYSPQGEQIILAWCSGLLLPESVAQARPSGMTAEAAIVDQVFITLLDKCTEVNRRLSDSSHASNYAPKVFAARPDRQGYTKRHFELAMQRLFASSKIKLQDYGRKSDARRCIVRTSIDDAEHPAY